METSELLRELRIDRDGRSPRTRRRWLLLAAVALVALAARVARLDAAGVPTVPRGGARRHPGGRRGLRARRQRLRHARRQATVSAKVTGKVTEVLIEEGYAGAGRSRPRPARRYRGEAQAGARARPARRRARAGREIRAQLQQAERDHARAQELFNASSSPSSRWTPRALSATPCARSSRQPGADSRGRRVRDRRPGPARQHRDPRAVQRHRDRQGCPARRDDLADLAGGGFTRTGIGTIVDMDSLEIQWTSTRPSSIA